MEKVENVGEGILYNGFCPFIQKMEFKKIFNQSLSYPPQPP